MSVKSRHTYTIYFLDISFFRECGEIGRHDGLKIRCLVISVRVQVPPFPI